MAEIETTVGRLSLLASVFAPIIAASATCEKDGDDAKRHQTEQTVVLLRRLITDSDPVRRVENSRHPETQEAIEYTRLAVVEAIDALNSDCISLASELPADGLALASQAFRSIVNTSSQGKQASDALHRQAVSLLESLESQPVDGQGIDEEEMVGIRRQALLLTARIDVVSCLESASF